MRLPDPLQIERQRLPHMTLDLPSIQHLRQLPQNLPVRIHLYPIIRLRAQQFPDKRQRLGHELSAVHGDLLVLHDTAHLPERRADHGRVDDVLGRGRVRDEDVLDRRVELQLFDLPHDVLAMVDRVRGAHLLTERRRLLAGGRRHHDRQFQHEPRNLRRHRSHPARSIHDQDPGILPLSDLQPFRQRLERRDPRQRHRGRLRHAQRLRFVRHGAGVHELGLGVGAMADRAAGVEDLVAGLETLDFGADGFDDTRAVEADDLGEGGGAGVVVWVVVVGAGADFGVDGVDGAGLDSVRGISDRSPVWYTGVNT